jgi:sugar/nucleoside kinase (ribokinase family)
MQTIVFGNVTLDIICYPVDDVPRHDSLSFEEAIVSPGGCASNTAIGLASLGVPTGLVAHTGNGDAASLLQDYWGRLGVNTRFVQAVPGVTTGISVGLVDSDLSPRFVHTSGANATLTADDLDVQALMETDIEHLHIAGFFVLPGLLDEVIVRKLVALREEGISTSLDVVFNERMDDPDMRAVLWQMMPNLDYFLCNDFEAFRLTGIDDPLQAAQNLKGRGASNVIVKLGEKGSWLEADSGGERIPAPQVEVVDTTGAGDAFAAGFVAALLRGEDVASACRAGNQAGARICTKLGAIEAWLA